jgi:hypothetical protein
MNGFQLLGISLLGCLTVLTLGAAARRRLTPLAAAAWSALWIGAALAIARPNSTIVVAHALGIQRGADLVMYCAILSGLGAFFSTFLRLRRLEAELTLVVRELALHEAAGQHEPPVPSPHSASGL